MQGIVLLSPYLTHKDNLRHMAEYSLFHGLISMEMYNRLESQDCFAKFEKLKSKEAESEIEQSCYTAVRISCVS